MSEETEVKMPTKAKVIKDIDELIKENQTKLIIVMTETGSANGVLQEALLDDIEHLKRIKEALKQGITVLTDNKALINIAANFLFEIYSYPKILRKEKSILILGSF